MSDARSRKRHGEKPGARSATFQPRHVDPLFMSSSCRRFVVRNRLSRPLCIHTHELKSSISWSTRGSGGVLRKVCMCVKWFAVVLGSTVVRTDARSTDGARGLTRQRLKEHSISSETPKLNRFVI